MRAQEWVKELQKQEGPGIVIALSGNKADLSDFRAVEADVTIIRFYFPSCLGRDFHYLLYLSFMSLIHPDSEHFTTCSESLATCFSCMFTFLWKEFKVF